MTQEKNFLSDLGSAMLRGYTIGKAVKAGKDGENADALASEPMSQDLQSDLMSLLGGNATMMDAVRELDSLVAKHSELLPLKEYLFDLVMLKIIQDGTEREGDDFLDSNEMIDLEESTLDRGTELLNLLVYLRDCSQNELEPKLTDFLNEFLLIEEEDFEDEFFIYEDVIRNQGLVKESMEAIVEEGANVEADEMAEIFAPMMAFFSETLPRNEATLVALAKASPEAEVHAALYSVMLKFMSMK